MSHSPAPSDFMESDATPRPRAVTPHITPPAHRNADGTDATDSTVDPSVNGESEVLDPPVGPRPTVPLLREREAETHEVRPMFLPESEHEVRSKQTAVTFRARGVEWPLFHESDDGASETALGGASLAALGVDVVEQRRDGRRRIISVRVTHHGAKPTRDLEVELHELEGLRLSRAFGPTEVRAFEDHLEFQPLSVVEPGAMLLWRIEVDCETESRPQVRLRVDSGAHDPEADDEIRPIIPLRGTTFIELPTPKQRYNDPEGA